MRLSEWGGVTNVQNSLVRIILLSVSYGNFPNFLLTTGNVFYVVCYWFSQNVMKNLDVSDLVWSALKSDGIEITIRPVYRWLNRNEIRYHQCLVACPGRDGREMLAGEFVAALEECGLIRLLDRHVFGRVVTLLGAQPELVVEINVSALSAVLDVSWEAVFLSLSDTPNVAHRLAVVISKSASVDMSRMWTFARRLQQLGCSVLVS
jgi:EAL domain-containing protein (putative c-di-GMP-specific phosphodiesterase class I)